MFHNLVLIEQETACYSRNNKFYHEETDEYEDVPFLSELFIEKWHIGFIEQDVIFNARNSFKAWLYHDMLNIHYSVLNEEDFGTYEEQLNNTKTFKSKIERLFEITEVKSEMLYWYCSNENALPLNILTEPIQKMDDNIIMSFLSLYFGKENEDLSIQQDSSKKYNIWKAHNNDVLEKLESMWQSCLLLINEEEIEELNESARLYGYIKFRSENMSVVNTLLTLYNSQKQCMHSIDIDCSI